MRAYFLDLACDTELELVVASEDQLGTYDCVRVPSSGEGVAAIDRTSFHVLTITGIIIATRNASTMRFPKSTGISSARPSWNKRPAIMKAIPPSRRLRAPTRTP